MMNWTFAAHDNSLIGWLITILYFVAAGSATIAWRATREANPYSSVRVYSIWLLAALTLLFLGVNKQLDLQTWFIAAMRNIARRQGWYGLRRATQYWFAVVCVLLLAGGLLWIVRHVDWTDPKHWLVLVAFGTLAAFLGDRVATICHVYRYSDFLRLWGDDALELTGIAAVTSTALLTVRACPVHQTHDDVPPAVTNHRASEIKV